MGKKKEKKGKKCFFRGKIERPARQWDWGKGVVIRVKDPMPTGQHFDYGKGKAECSVVFCEGSLSKPSKGEIELKKRCGPSP